MATIPGASTRYTFKLDDSVYNGSDTPFLTFDNGITVTMRLDANLCIYDGSGGIEWESATSQGGDFPASDTVLKLQQDGNVVIYFRGNPIWETDTAERGVNLCAFARAPYLMVTDKYKNMAWISKQYVG